LPCGLPRRTGQFEMVAIEDVSLLNASSLEQFDGVLFTSRELPVSESPKSDLQEFVPSGKGFMGVVYIALQVAEYGDSDRCPIQWTSLGPTDPAGPGRSRSPSYSASASVACHFRADLPVSWFLSFPFACADQRRPHFGGPYRPGVNPNTEDFHRPGVIFMVRAACRLWRASPGPVCSRWVAPAGLN
jgi:hypothetical protein